MKAVKGEEIVVITENKLGRLEEVTAMLKDKDINIRAINAYVSEEKAIFRILTSNNIRAKELLKNIGEVQTKDIVVAEIPDEVGKLNILSSKLKDANIDIKYLYGTTSEPKTTAIIIFSCSDNERAVDLISSF